MKLSIKISDILNFLLMVVLSIIVYYIGTEIFQFCFIIFLLFIIVRKAKFSFFSVLTFLLVFTLFQEFAMDVFNVGTGMLKTGRESKNHFNELYICTNIFCVVEYLFMSVTKIIENEREFYLLKINISSFLAKILSFMSLIITLLIFPSIPNFKTTTVNRFTSGILPFSGFAGLALLLIGITYDAGKKNKIIYFNDFLIVLWFFGHAERVEALGLIVYLLLKYINQSSEDLKNFLQVIKKHYKLIFLCFLLVVFLVIIGLTRDGKSAEDGISLNLILSRIFVQSTASDVAYIFNCSVELFENGNMFNGSTYMSYLSKLLLFFEHSISPEEAIQQYYFTMGGCPFFAEIVMNFGMKGILPMITIFFLVHSLILRKVTMFRAIFWIPIVIEIFRTAWYGWTGWFRMSVYMVPIIYFLINRVNVKIRGISLLKAKSNKLLIKNNKL